MVLGGVMVVLLGLTCGAVLSLLTDEQTNAAERGPAAAAKLAANSQECTEDIKRSQRWACLSRATFDGERMVIRLNSEFSDSKPNSKGGFHIHIFGSDGKNSATGPPGRYLYPVDKPLSVRKAAGKYAGIGEFPYLCARTVDRNHNLLPDARGSSLTGNCVPVERISSAGGTRTAGRSGDDSGGSAASGSRQGERTSSGSGGGDPDSSSGSRRGSDERASEDDPGREQSEQDQSEQGQSEQGQADPDQTGSKPPEGGKADEDDAGQNDPDQKNAGQNDPDQKNADQKNPDPRPGQNPAGQNPAGQPDGQNPSGQNPPGQNSPVQAPLPGGTGLQIPANPGGVPQQPSLRRPTD
jgi:hypothetical protein